TPGRRFSVVNTFDALTTDKPEKSLLAPQKKTGGRNHSGKMTTRNRGGGHKRRYRIIDFKRDKKDQAGEVLTIEYDPNRSAFIALIQYEDDEKRYIIAPNGLKVGQKIISSDKNVPTDIGNCMPLGEIPFGTVVSCIELQPGRGASLVRSAGSFAQLV